MATLKRARMSHRRDSVGRSDGMLAGPQAATDVLFNALLPNSPNIAFEAIRATAKDRGCVMTKIIVAAVAGLIAFRWPHVTVLTCGRLAARRSAALGAWPSIRLSLMAGGPVCWRTRPSEREATQSLARRRRQNPGPRGARARARITMATRSASNITTTEVRQTVLASPRA